MFHKGVLEGLRGKTRLVVLNSHLHLLAKFDHVLVMDGGRFVACASPADMMAFHRDIYLKAVGSISENGKGHAGGGAANGNEGEGNSFMPLSAEALSMGVEKGGEEGEDDIGDFSASSVKALSASASVNGEVHLQRERSLTASSAVSLSVSDSTATDRQEGGDGRLQGESGPTTGQLIQVEKSIEGAVSIHTIIAYFGAVFWKDSDSSPNAVEGGLGMSTVKGGAVVAVIVFSFAVTQLTRVAVDLQLMSWAAQDQGGKHSPYFTGYVVCMGLYTVCVLLAAKIIIWFSVRSAYRIHSMMFRHVLAAPINLFFDVQTVGSMLNRFGKVTYEH